MKRRLPFGYVVICFMQTLQHFILKSLFIHQLLLEHIVEMVEQWTLFDSENISIKCKGTAGTDDYITLYIITCTTFHLGSHLCGFYIHSAKFHVKLWFSNAFHLCANVQAQRLPNQWSTCEQKPVEIYWASTILYISCFVFFFCSVKTFE